MIVSPEYLIAGILTTLTNLALLIFIISNKTLRTSKNATIASSLVVGILFATIYVIPQLAIFDSDGQTNMIHDFRCGMLSRFGQALYLSLNLHLITHVSEFYIQIVYPFYAKEWLRKKNITIILAVIWSTTILPPIIIQIYLEIEAMSKGGFHGRDCRRTFTTFFIITSIILAVLSIIIIIVSSFAYAHVLNITNNTIKETHKILIQLSHNSNNSCIESSRESKQLSNLKLRLKSTVQAIVIYVCYLIPLMPFLILVIYTHFTFTLRHRSPPSGLIAVLLIFQYMSYLFPAIQPIVFFMFTAEYRNQLKLCRKRATFPV